MSSEVETSLIVSPDNSKRFLDSARNDASKWKIMIRKIKGGYRLYSRKKNPKTGKRRNLGTFKTLAAAKKHERAVQYFKRN
jgi:hypothetical protein